MSKLRFLVPGLLAFGAGAMALPAAATILGKDAAVCQAGKPSLVVRVSGFKRPSGTVKVALYQADGYLVPKGSLDKVKAPVRSDGPIDLCVPVPGPGTYAVVVHHDVNANGDKDWSDGAGFSNNPKLSILAVKPPFNRTAIEVGTSPRRVDVVLQYRKGLAVRPVSG